MSMPTLDEAVAQLPSFRHFADAVARDALGGRHALLLTGGAVDESYLRSGVEAALLRNQGPSLRPVFLSDCDVGEPPVSFLARVTGLSEDQLHPKLKSEATGDDFQPVYEVFLLEGLERLPPARAEPWLEFFRLTAKYGGSASHVFVLPLCRLPRALAGMTSDTRLALYWWWRRLSVLDMRLVCRLGEQSPANSPETVWREAVLPHLVVGDLSLATQLWDTVLQSEAVLMSALREHGRQRGLEAVSLREAIRRRGRPGRDLGQEGPLPATWLPLWEMAAAQCSVEHGPELTVLALAILEDVSGLRSRMWRGQAELLLPLLARLRMAICQILTDKHGRGWPLRYGKAWMDEEQQRLAAEDPLSTEFGPLELILKRAEVGGQRYQAIAQALRLMRNLLAHNMAVSFGDFKDLWQMREELNLS
ncbi:hypothetical protein [Corallococcus carmarthensis]|uniref:hypothetical protein n=1 Tax=Corallococcus carmarthensis TaxID=2316728 RepID=UPI00148C711C|nr:hypothetical protein [Corallococcus carmarthensis]NOK17821.1 hypothetical protein [Corallococcus carmarthensis]